MGFGGVFVIVGIKGFGKTTLLRELVASSDRVIVIDPMGSLGPEWWRRADRRHLIVYDGKIPDTRSLPIAGPFYMRIPIRYSDEGGTIHDAVKLALRLENVTLAVDEADTWIGRHNVPTLLRFTLHTGRHYGIRIAVTARRATDLPRLLTSQADELAYFRTSEPRDLLYLRERTGIVPDAVSSLPRGSYWHYDGLSWTPDRTNPKYRLTGS